METPQPEQHKKLIIILSIAIPVAVAALFGIKIPGYDFTFLPPIYAAINGVTAVLLLLSLIAIKNGDRKTHEGLIKVCLALSGLFLIMYVLYHITTESTEFGGEGGIRYVYFFILISHILLSITVIPFVLFTFSRAQAGNFERHKRLAKFTFPIWLYVSITGVVVYLMISPYYRMR